MRFVFVVFAAFALLISDTISPGPVDNHHGGPEYRIIRSCEDLLNANNFNSIVGPQSLKYEYPMQQQTSSAPHSGPPAPVSAGQPPPPSNSNGRTFQPYATSTLTEHQRTAYQQAQTPTTDYANSPPGTSQKSKTGTPQKEKNFVHKIFTSIADKVVKWNVLYLAPMIKNRRAKKAAEYYQPLDN